MTTSIALAGAAGALLLLVEHYALLPYVRHIWRKDMPVLIRYVLGTLALNGVLVMLFWLDPTAPPASAVIWVTAMGGLAVLAAYGFDWVVEAIAQWREETELKAHR